MNFQPASCCRICLKTDLLMSIYIYSPTFLMRPIEMIEKLHIFKTQPDDNLPTLLCQSCLYRVLDAYNLQQLAEASERRLREYLGGGKSTGAGNSCVLASSSITPETSSFSSVTVTQDTTKDADATAAIYANICDMFERNVHSNDIVVDCATAGTEDVLNDVEIDVSSLTRSEANDDTLSEVLVAGHIDIGCDDKSSLMDVSVPTQLQISEEQPQTKTSTATKRCQRRAKLAKVPEQCLECGKIFNYMGYLEAHKRTHTGEKPFKCKHCARSFTQSSNLLLHQRTHTGERRFQCEICAAFFTTSSNLKAHKATHAQRNHQCVRCARCFKSARELRRHEPVHHAIKDNVCEQCQKGFTKRSYLRAHIALMHRDVRRHKCDECAKVFGSRSNLVCHMRTHTGEKPFQCKYCPWKFSQSSALMRHVNTHLKSKIFDTHIKASANPTGSGTTLINNALHNAESTKTDAALLPLQSNLNGLLPLANLSAMPRINEVSLSGIESQFQEFTKDGILDFSTSQQQQIQAQSLY